MPAASPGPSSSLEDSQLRSPRNDEGTRAALRILIVSRDHISHERTASINALIALLRVVDIGVDARRTITAGRSAEIAPWRARTEELAIGVARAEAVRLDKRVRAADEELAEGIRQMTALLTTSPAEGLRDQPGVGPVTAALAYAGWSHPGRFRSEAAFASPAGTSPIPASSANTVRHRIDRGGDRRFDRALHIAVVTRMRTDPDTRAHMDRRTAEGRATREIRRSLKRYLARQIYRQLSAASTPTAPA